MDENVKTKKKIWPKIIIGVVAAAVVAGAAMVGVWANQPKNVLKRSLKKTTKLVRKSEFGGFTEETLQGGSASLNFNLNDFINAQDATDAEEVKEYLKDTAYKGTIKAYFNAKGQKEANEIKISNGDAKIIDAFLAADEKHIIIKETEILKNAYELKFDDFAANFKKSIFNDENSDYFLDIDEEVIDGIGKALEESKEVRELAEKATESALEILCDAVENNLNVENGKGKVEFDDNDEKVKEIIIKGNGKKLVAAAKEFLLAVKKDEDVKNLVKKIDKDFYDGFKKEFEEGIESALQEIELMTADDKEAAAKAKFELSFKILKKTGSLVGFTMELDNDSEEYGCEFLMGPNVENPDEIKLSIKNGEDVTGARYFASKNTDKELAAEIEYWENDESGKLAKITWDKKSGAFDVDVDVDGEETKIHLNVLKTSDKLTVSGNGSYIEIKNYDEKIRLDGFEFVIDKSDKMPDISEKAKDVLSLKADDIEELMNNITEFYENNEFLQNLFNTNTDIDDPYDWDDDWDDDWTDDWTDSWSDEDWELTW